MGKGDSMYEVVLLGLALLVAVFLCWMQHFSQREMSSEARSIRRLTESIRGELAVQYDGVLRVGLYNPGGLGDSHFLYIEQVVWVKWGGVLPYRKKVLIFDINPWFFRGPDRRLKELYCQIHDSRAAEVVERRVRTYAAKKRATPYIRRPG